MTKTNVTANPHILVLRGLPGSGKSYYANLPQNKSYSVVSRDPIRSMICDGAFSRELEDIVVETMLTALRLLIKAGHSVIVDNIHLDPKHIDFIRDAAKELCVEVSVQEMATPLQTCIQRDSKRENPVGEAVIRKHHEKWYS